MLYALQFLHVKQPSMGVQDEFIESLQKMMSQINASIPEVREKGFLQVWRELSLNPSMYE